jgi:hypothetical protein
LDVTSSTGWTNTATSTLTIGGQSPLPATIGNTYTYSLGISYDKKEIVHQLLDSFNHQTTDKIYSNDVMDFLIDPWKLSAGYSWGPSLQTQHGLVTDKASDQGIWKVQLDYTLSLETIMQRFPVFQK